MIKVGTLFSGIGAPEQALTLLKVPPEIEFACDFDSEKRTYSEEPLFEYLFHIRK